MSNGTYDLKWGQDLAAKISSQIKSEVGRIQVDPPLIPIVPGKSSYDTTVQSFKVTVGPPLSIDPTSPLAPAKISLKFLLQQGQFTDEVLAGRLALRAASDLAFAKDAIILHGEHAAALFKTRKLEINDDNNTLRKQEGLFQAPPQSIDTKKSVVDSVLEGIQKLNSGRQYPPYCVLVSPDLHREAMTPIGDSGIARIAPILPQLRQDGFRFSEAATDRTGVVFALGGGAIDLAVPWDVHVECLELKGDAIFVVVEQFVLRINDPRAVVTLS